MFSYCSVLHLEKNSQFILKDLHGVYLLLVVDEFSDLN